MTKQGHFLAGLLGLAAAGLGHSLDFGFTPRGEQPTWAQKHLAGLSTPLSTSSTTPGSVNHGYSVLPESPFVGKTIEGRVLLASEESRRIFAKANKAAIYLNELVRRNQLDRASAYVNELRREHLDISEGYFVDPLIDLEFLKGRFGGAEEILEKTFQWNRDGYELLFLKLSLCLAKRGIVYEDQADYCRKSSVERLQWIFDTPFNLKELLPSFQKKNPRSVQIESCLALGLAGRHYYYDLALRIDPGCAFAAARLASYYSSKQQYTEARKVINRILPLLSEGPVKESFAAKRKSMDHWVDNPTEKPLVPPDLRSDPP